MNADPFDQLPDVERRRAYKRGYLENDLHDFYMTPNGIRAKFKLSIHGRRAGFDKQVFGLIAAASAPVRKKASTSQSEVKQTEAPRRSKRLADGAPPADSALPPPNKRRRKASATPAADAEEDVKMEDETKAAAKSVPQRNKRWGAQLNLDMKVVDFHHDPDDHREYALLRISGWQECAIARQWACHLSWPKFFWSFHGGESRFDDGFHWHDIPYIDIVREPHMMRSQGQETVASFWRLALDDSKWKFTVREPMAFRFDLRLGCVPFLPKEWRFSHDEREVKLLANPESTSAKRQQRVIDDYNNGVWNMVLNEIECWTTPEKDAHAHMSLSLRGLILDYVGRLL